MANKLLDRPNDELSKYSSTIQELLVPSGTVLVLLLVVLVQVTGQSIVSGILLL